MPLPRAANDPDDVSPAHQSLAPDDALPVVELTARVFETFDQEHGGFGVAPKFPLVAPIQLALDLVPGR